MTARLWAALGPAAGDADGAGGAAGARRAAHEAAVAGADPDALPVCVEAAALVCCLDPAAFATLGSERGEKPLHLEEAFLGVVMGRVRGPGGPDQCAALRLLHAWAGVPSAARGAHLQPEDSRWTRPALGSSTSSSPTQGLALVDRREHVGALVPACAAAVEAGVAACVAATASGAAVYPYHAVVAVGACIIMWRL